MLKTVALALILMSAGASFAQGTDLPNSADHPVLKRFSGSWITGYAAQDWAQTQLPASGKINDKTETFESWQTLEGKVTRLHYLSPEGKAALEVFRNYQQALQAAGLQPKVLCELNCKPLFRAWWYIARPRPSSDMAWARLSIPGSNGLDHRDAPNEREGRLIVGSLRGPSGAPLHVLVYVSSASNTDGRLASTFVQIVEPKPMQTGQVTVDAKAIGQGLKDEGKVALYGVLFDTGKTEVLPDSKAQLDQMAAVLKAQPALKVFVVGHTDNLGALDANLALSQGRAQAVVAALAQRGIAAARLQARGVANLAPVASNASEDGRAKNRRVEMVLQ